MNADIKQDVISINRIKLLHPALREDALNCYNEALTVAKVSIRVVQSLRTFEEQQNLYAQGRTKPGKIVTKAKPGFSFHNYGLALDFCLLHEDKTVSWNRNEDMDRDKISDWVEVVKIFKKRGWTWGGDFVSIFDAPHFEKTFGLSISDCYKLWTDHEVDENGYIKL